jgi:hypothetical protein
MWNRYWVTYQPNHLILRSNERGGGEPIERMALQDLKEVDINPSEDIKEEIYLGKKHGIILTFGKSNMYLFCDSYKSVRYWKCLLEQCKSSSNRQHINNTYKIHKKYLWSSVAQ